MHPLGSWFDGWRRPDRPETCLVTWRLAATQLPLKPRERQLVFDTVLAGNRLRYELLAMVVMDDHVHVLVRGGPEVVGQLARSWRASASHQLQRLHRRSTAVWADASDVVAVRDEDKVRALADCILGNPWKRWPFLQGYEWVYHGIEK